MKDCTKDLRSGSRVEFTEPLAKVEVKHKYLMLWTCERGLDMFKSWTLGTDQSKELMYEEHVRPQSNELIAGLLRD